MLFRRLILASLGVVAIAAFAAAAEARPGQGRGQRPQPTPAAIETAPLFEPSEVVVPAPELAVETPTAVVEVPDPETPDSVTVTGGGTTDPGADAAEPQNLPPGLQRQVDSDRGLPPGLQRQVDSDRGLPPGLQR
jgi:hypothetical protein